MAMISLFTTNLQAGTVSIDTTYVGGITPCDSARRVMFYMEGTSSGYNIGDTMSLEIFFGDGSTDTLYGPVTDTTGRFYWHRIPHFYPSNGQYTVAYIATGPDMSADTIIVPNQVILQDSCGNISGQIYADVNNNCVLDGSETPLAGVQVSAYQGTQYIYSDWTDTNGYYYIDVPIGQTYTITTSANYGYNTICPASGSHTISTVPSNGNDFAIDCGTGFDLYPIAHGWSVPGQNLKKREK